MQTELSQHAPVPLAECALARAIRAIGDGWTLLILREAICGVERFDVMHDDLGIPRSVLSQRLARMVEEGVFERRPYREPGRRKRYEYVLTSKGRALIPMLVAMRSWAEDHVAGGPSRLRLQTEDGQDVSARLIRADGTVLDDTVKIIATVKS